MTKLKRNGSQRFLYGMDDDEPGTGSTVDIQMLIDQGVIKESKANTERTSVKQQRAPQLVLDASLPGPPVRRVPQRSSSGEDFRPTRRAPQRSASGDGLQMMRRAPQRTASGEDFKDSHRRGVDLPMDSTEIVATGNPRPDADPPQALTETVEATMTIKGSK